MRAAAAQFLPQRKPQAPMAERVMDMVLRSTEYTLRRCMRKLIRQKKLSTITVSDICEMAQIGKRTFYRYYADKYALFEDTYVKEFFYKLNITEDTYLYDIYEHMAEQMYKEQEFFSHAIASREQNGFWDVVSDLVFPYVHRLVTSDPYIDRSKEYYIRKDTEIALHHFEVWIQNGFRQSPKELVGYIRMCNALHGKWQYQIATRKTPDIYSLDKYENDEW